MKKIIISLCMVLAALAAVAQGSKQTRIMLEQLLKLQVQNKLSSTGNNENSQGLAKIRQQKNDKYSTFQHHFTSLKQVSPKVAQNDNIEKIKMLFFEIRKLFPLTIDNAGNSGFFEFYEVQYFRKVYQRVEKDCSNILLTLNKITSPGNLEMGDAERLQQIDQLYGRMFECYRFTKEFCTSVESTKATRKQSREDRHQIGELHGLQTKPQRP